MVATSADPEGVFCAGRLVAIGLGSNLGNRQAHLRFAIERLRHLLGDLRVSRFIDTAPWGVGPQPRYLNAAAVGTSTDSPRGILDALLAIECECGRQRPFTGAPRTLDLDLILCGDLVVNEGGLQVPHPRFRERRFVLEPLAEIAPELVDPVSGLSVGELLAALSSATR